MPTVDAITNFFIKRSFFIVQQVFNTNEFTSIKNLSICMNIPSLEIIQQVFLELWIKIGDFSSLHRRKTHVDKPMYRVALDFRSSFLSMSIVSMILQWNFH